MTQDQGQAGAELSAADEQVLACDEDRYRILSQSIRSGRRPVAGGRLVVR
jgi:hypothetical protein